MMHFVSSNVLQKYTRISCVFDFLTKILSTSQLERKSEINEMIFKKKILQDMFFCSLIFLFCFLVMLFLFFLIHFRI